MHTGAVHLITEPLRSLDIAGSFIAGTLFTSVFTTAPAIVILAELAQDTSSASVAFWGGLGAMAGDYVIFRLMRDRIAQDIEYILRLARAKKIITMLRTVRFRWMATIIGAAIIASPLPDELGLTLLGMSRVSSVVVLPLMFALNAGGIYLIGEVARALQF